MDPKNIPTGPPDPALPLQRRGGVLRAPEVRGPAAAGRVVVAPAGVAEGPEVVALPEPRAVFEKVLWT